MPTSTPKLTTPSIRSLALVIGAIWLISLILALVGTITASTAAGMAVGSLVGVGLAGLGLFIGLRRAAVDEADTSRLDSLEPLPRRER